MNEVISMERLGPHVTVPHAHTPQASPLPSASVSLACTSSSLSVNSSHFLRSCSFSAFNWSTSTPVGAPSVILMKLRGDGCSLGERAADD